VQHVQPLQQVQPQPQVQVQAQPIQQEAQQLLQQQPQPLPELARSESLQQQPQPKPQPQRQNTLPQAAATVQPQPQPAVEELESAASAAPAPVDNGPPYVYNPTGTYSDPNVQAWASYYAQGGTDPAGAVYFIFVPGVKPAPSAPVAAPAEGGAGGLQRIESYGAGQGQQGGQPQPVAALVAGPHAKRYQLTDTGFLGSGGPQQQQPEQQRHDSGLSYASSLDVGHQPTSIDTNVAAAGPFASPSQSTPSWVLPKRGAA
jgi:signal transducing adaptor molecule